MCTVTAPLHLQVRNGGSPQKPPRGRGSLRGALEAPVWLRPGFWTAGSGSLPLLRPVRQLYCQQGQLPSQLLPREGLGSPDEQAAGGPGAPPTTGPGTQEARPCRTQAHRRHTHGAPMHTGGTPTVHMAPSLEFEPGSPEERGRRWSGCGPPRPRGDGRSGVEEERAPREHGCLPRMRRAGVGCG